MRIHRPVGLFVTVLCLMAAGCSVAPPPAAPEAAAPATPAKDDTSCAWPYVFTASEEQMLDDLEHRIVDYFWTEVYPETGIAIDHTENRIGKIAATGFGLAAICIGVERGWIPRQDGYDRALQILNVFWDDPDDPNDMYADGHFGLWWHFLDGKTAKLLPMDCVAPCDSADLVAGILVAGEYFRDTEVERLARKIYDNVQWDRFVAKRPDGSPDLMAFGWVPPHVSESFPDTDGLLNFNMSGFVDNSLLIYVLALGSDTHPIPQATWERYVDSYTLGEYGGYECMTAGQLFCWQVPNAFVPFSRLRDRKIDYFLDAVNALLADRVFNMNENDYPPQLWGLTDVFGKDTYSHGAPPGPIMNDGTVGTTAFAGALPHVPGLSLEAMKYVRATFGDRVWGKYGFTSSVNLKNNFVSPLYVGIELGPMIQLIENARSGLIWDLFRRTPAMKNFVRRAGMSGVVDDFELPPEAPAYAEWTVQGGRAKPGDDAPRHGRKCLEIRPARARVRIEARLPANQLLAYHFGGYLSLWARDLDLASCTVLLDGKPVALELAGRLPGAEWVHYCYRMPPHSEASALCGVTIEAGALGPRAALDNITLEAEADLSAPDPIADLAAATGKLGSSIELTWTAPADQGGGRVTRYILRAVETADPAKSKLIELGAAAEAGAAEKQAVLLESGKAYALSLAALDNHGHEGPFSQPVEARANPAPLKSVAYAFDDGSLTGCVSSNPNWTLAVADDGGNKALRVDFEKSHAWNPLELDVDPAMVALHRYVTLRVKGQVELLGKLWCRDALQQDMEAFKSRSDADWTVFKYDTRKANSITPARDPVLKLILFPQPGVWSGRGTFFLDDIGYANE